MRTLSNSILRSACSLVIGVLLVVWPETAMIYLVITIGVLFLIPGLISLLGYFAHRTGEAKQMFPIAALVAHDYAWFFCKHLNVYIGCLPCVGWYSTHNQFTVCPS